MPKIDMGNVEELQPLPAAWYDTVLSEYEYVEESESSGEPYVKLTFAIEDGSEFEGRKVFRNQSLQPQSLWAFKRTLIALGANNEEVSGEFDLDDVMEPLVGNPCRIKVSLREYEDRETNQVDRIAPSA